MTRKRGVPPPDPLAAELDKLAVAVLTEALTTNPPLTEKISALRAGSAYYAMTRKLPPPPGEKASGISGYRDALKGSAGGSPSFPALTDAEGDG